MQNKIVAKYIRMQKYNYRFARFLAVQVSRNTRSNRSLMYQISNLLVIR